MTFSGYPAAARSDLREDLHGHLVADPYRDLEDFALRTQLPAVALEALATAGA